MRCCASWGEKIRESICGSSDGSCDLCRGLFGKRGLCTGSSEPATSQVLLPRQQQALRALLLAVNSVVSNWLWVLYPMVTRWVMGAELGKHRLVLLHKKQPAASAALGAAGCRSGPVSLLNAKWWQI